MQIHCSKQLDTVKKIEFETHIKQEYAEPLNGYKNQGWKKYKSERF